MTRHWLLLALACTLSAQPVLACCPAPPPGVEVKIADQEVLIVYDEDSGMEHFVRSASFKGQSKGFGFLVPTPTQPELAEADVYVFANLRQQIAPRVVYETSYYPVPGCLCLMAKSASDGATAKSVDAGGEPMVEVLQRTEVAGYDAAVLAANDAGALLEWLKTNGFDARPELKEWAEPYVKQAWIITAFNYKGLDADAAEVSAKTVRMSFKTDRPLFPYRVPTDQLAPPGKGNMLRLFYVGSMKVQGALGAAATAWGASTKYAKPVSGLSWQLSGALPKDALKGKQLWLTAFEDGTWPGGTEDLFFSAATDPSEVEPPPVVRTRRKAFPVPVEPFLFVAAIVGVVVWRRRRSAKQATNDG